MQRRSVGTGIGNRWATSRAINRWENFIAQLVLQHQEGRSGCWCLSVILLCLNSVWDLCHHKRASWWCILSARTGCAKVCKHIQYIDKQVGKTIKTLRPSVLIGRTFLGPTPSTEYVTTDKYIHGLFSLSDTVRYGMQLFPFPLSEVVNSTKIANRTVPLFATLSLGYLAQQRVPKGWSLTHCRTLIGWLDSSLVRDTRG